MNERWHRVFTKNDADFKELFGVKKEIFQEMLAILIDAREKRRHLRHRGHKMSTLRKKFPKSARLAQVWRGASIAFVSGLHDITQSGIITLSNSRGIP